VKLNSSYKEFNKIAGILIPPKTNGGKGIHDDFSFVCLSRYIKTSWEKQNDGKSVRVYNVCIRMYLQTKQQTKRANYYTDTRFTIDDIETMLDTDGLQQWEPPFPLGTKDKSPPYLLVHSVFGCADITYCVGEIRTKGKEPGKGASAEELNQPSNKGILADDDEEDSAVASLYGEDECKIIGVKKPTKLKPVKREKTDILVKILVVNKQRDSHEDGRKKRAAAALANKNIKKQRILENDSEDFFNPKNEEKSVSSTESNNNFDLRPEDDGHPVYSDEEEEGRKHELVSPTSIKYSPNEKMGSPTKTVEPVIKRSDTDKKEPDDFKSPMKRADVSVNDKTTPKADIDPLDIVPTLEEIEKVLRHVVREMIREKEEKEKKRKN